MFSPFTVLSVYLLWSLSGQLYHLESGGIGVLIFQGFFEQWGGVGFLEGFSLPVAIIEVAH